jgi:NAD(P)H-hydrate epimerase
MSRPVPHVTAAQMREVDRLMTEELGIGLPRMMESAGRLLARLARTRFLGGDVTGKPVLVLAGPGGNGGGAAVAARALHLWGARVRVCTSTNPATFGPVPREQLDILVRLGVPVAEGPPAPRAAPAALVIDGLIGYSLAGPPHGAAADLIRWAAGQPTPVLALDVPSGLDATTGAALPPTVRAAATLTLALPKTGLAAESARPFVGDLYLADIGVPPQLLAAPPFELDVGELFAREEIIRLR